MDDTTIHIDGAPGRMDVSHLRSARGFILHFVQGRRLSFLGILGVVVAAALCGVGVQYVIKLVVDAMMGPPALSRRILVTLGCFLALLLVEGLCWRVLGWLVCRTTVGIGVDVRLDLFGYLSGHSMRYFAENLAGSLGQRVTATAGNFGALTNTVVWRTLPPLIDFLGAIVIFAAIDRRLALALAMFVTAVTAGLIWFGARGRSIHGTYSGKAAQNAGDLVDTIANMWTLKAFSAARREWMRHRAHFQAEADAQRRSWMYLEKSRLLHDIALMLMAGGMVAGAVFLWVSRQATPGDVVIVFTLTFRILHSSKDLALSLVDLAQQFGFIEETLAVIGRTQSVSDAPGAPALIADRGEIVFRGVRFSYGAAETLHDIDLVIPARQKIGIVGPSGAGKSTLIHLIQRLYDVQQGEILIDGQSIADVRQESLRAALAVVPQEISLLHRSVAENIRFSRPGATDAEVHAAARAAACDGFIRALPQGYDTIVGDRGTKLSGGQRQRIGIARAFLKQAVIIILDEATSALDPDCELEIQHALKRLMSDRTVIAVAHRLSTLAGFDRILVVDAGQVIEDGTFSDLIRQEGLFHRMWQRQAAGLGADGFVVAA